MSFLLLALVAVGGAALFLFLVFAEIAEAISQLMGVLP